MLAKHYYINYRMKIIFSTERSQTKASILLKSLPWLILIHVLQRGFTCYIYLDPYKSYTGEVLKKKH